MWFPAHPKHRTVSSPLARLGVGVLVPFLVAPALAQVAPPAIVATPAQAGRGEREKLAPAVMAQAEAALQAAQAADMAAFGEAVKRLRDVEMSDPAQALVQYQRFLVRRNPSPVLGVQVGIKVAQMRQKLGDFQGALLTCNVLGKKYEAEPSVALLYLQKARVLMGQKKLAQASECVDEALPDLMALGTQHYAETSDFLRQLAQANLVDGKEHGKERARVLDVGVEEIYLRWIKKDTVGYLWQRFEALQADYRKAGDEERAKNLLPKVEDMLLQIPPKPGNMEGAVLSLEAGRWLTQQGKNEQAAVFYKRIPEFHDGWHTFLGRDDQFQALISAGKLDEAKKLLSQPLDAVTQQSDVQVAQNALLASLAYQQGHMDEALRLGRKVKEAGESGQFSYGSSKDFYKMGCDIYLRAGGWKTEPLQCDVKEVVLKANPLHPDQPLYARFRIKTYGDQSVTATVDNPDVQVSVFPCYGYSDDLPEENAGQMEVVAHLSIKSFDEKPLLALIKLSSIVQPKFFIFVKAKVIEKS